MASMLSYKDIGFWSQVMFSASLFTSLVGFNIPNGIMAKELKLKKNMNLFFSQLYLYSWLD